MQLSIIRKTKICNLLAFGLIGHLMYVFALWGCEAREGNGDAGRIPFRKDRKVGVCIFKTRGEVSVGTLGRFGGKNT